MDRKVDHRCSGKDRLKGIVVTFLTVGISCGTVDTHDGDDIASGGQVDIFLLIGVNPQNPAHTLLLLQTAVEVEFALAKRALIDPRVGQLAKWLFHQFEGHAHKWKFVIRCDIDFFHIVIDIFGLDVPVNRAWKISRDGVEQGLNAFVLIG